MGRKVYNNQFEEPTLISWKALDHKISSIKDANSSQNNSELIEKLRTLEIVSMYIYLNTKTFF